MTDRLGKTNQARSLEEMARAALNRDPSWPIVEYEQRWYTYGELRHVTARLKVLLAESAAPDSAPIAFAPRNRPSALAALLGLIAEGKTVQMVYAFQSPAGLARDLLRLHPAVFIAAPQDLSEEVLDAARGAGIAVFALSDMEVKAVSGLEHVDPNAHDATAPSPPRIEILTSGTTGPPKQFPIPFELVANYLSGGRLMFSSHGAALSQMPPVLLFFPLGNITGIYSTVPTLILGQRIILLDRFSLDGWRDHLRRFQPAQSGMPPSCIRMILDADIPASELRCLKSLGTGAAPLDPSVHRAFEERYNIPILLAYGATEFGGRVAAMTLDLHSHWGAQKFGSVGRPVAGAKIRVVDPESLSPLPAGQEGLLEVVSPHMGDDWIRTTDLGVIDEDGFLFLHGRADGAITRGGFKILPETIERALLTHPAVAAAAVVGVPDRRLGQTPAAAIQLKAGVEPPSIAELDAHLRQRVLATHVPGHYRFVAELPKNPSMKVHRPAVAALFST